ncbi:THAP-type domain-containing protein [Trichonephila inaurata madagascariensis]|uniref:THAP-type domain-containing protein n=1 Tax=Trichonephila inaurata madagascariensis TaxID=2747483 RepID=A0A8X6XWL3_9ARAC|nr:THAP-type domain-containing protein [Trichonephila inaurata madagascariensis]
MCGMIGCSNRSGRDRVSFYRLPGTQRAADPAKKDLQLLRRAVWLTRICREDIVKDEKKLRHFRICNRHFIKNVPAALKDINDPDWAPTLFLGHNYFKPCRNGDKKRSGNDVEDMLYDPSLGRKWHPLLKQKKYYEETKLDEAFDLIEWRSSLKRRNPNEECESHEKSHNSSSVTIIYLRCERS